MPPLTRVPPLTGSLPPRTHDLRRSSQKKLSLSPCSGQDPVSDLPEEDPLGTHARRKREGHPGLVPPFSACDGLLVPLEGPAFFREAEGTAVGRA